MQDHFSPEAYRTALLEQLSAGGPQWHGTPRAEPRPRGSHQHLPSPTRNSFTDAQSDSGGAFRLDSQAHRQPKQHHNSHGQVHVDSSFLLDTHGPCDHHSGNGCPHHHSIIIDFIDNCVANNVPEPVIARQVEFMISSMEEIIGMHAALQERFHKDRQREFEISQLTNAVERQARLRQQERAEWGGRNRVDWGKGDDSCRRRTPSPPRLRAQSTERKCGQGTSPSLALQDTVTRRQTWRQQSVPPTPVENAVVTRLSPLRYGRAAYHMISPKQHEQQQRRRGDNDGGTGYRGGEACFPSTTRAALSTTPGPRRLCFLDSSPPPAYSAPSSANQDEEEVHKPPPAHVPRRATQQQRPSPKPTAVAPRGSSASYLRPTHSSFAHRSASRSTVIAASGERGRNCPSCDREGGGGGRQDHKRRHSGDSGGRASIAARSRLGEEELAWARQSVQRPTKASLLRAEATARRTQREGDAETGEDRDNSLADAGRGEAGGQRPPSRPAPRAPDLAKGTDTAALAPPPPLPAAREPRLSIEKRNGFSDSRDTTNTASSPSFVELLWQSAVRDGEGGGGDTVGSTLQTTNTFMDGGGEKGESPSLVLEREQVRRDFEEMLRPSDNRERPPRRRNSDSSTTAHAHTHQGGPWRGEGSGERAPLTSPELQLFIEVSQRKIRESERVVTRTTPNVSAIPDASSLLCLTNSSAAGTDSHSFAVHTPRRRWQSGVHHGEGGGHRGPPEAHSPMIEISPTSSDDD